MKNTPKGTQRIKFSFSERHFWCLKRVTGILRETTDKALKVQCCEEREEVNKWYKTYTECIVCAYLKSPGSSTDEAIRDRLNNSS